VEFAIQSEVSLREVKLRRRHTLRVAARQTLFLQLVLVNPLLEYCIFHSDVKYFVVLADNLVSLFCILLPCFMELINLDLEPVDRGLLGFLRELVGQPH